MQSIIVKHNVEMAHRLYLQPDSKCHNIHGHSWWVEVEIMGEPDDKGMILDFAKVKGFVREFLDTNFDHHLCLNQRDNLAARLEWLPGLVTIDVDPTVENMAMLWGKHIKEYFGNGFRYNVKVWEASSNAATWSG